MQKIATSPDEHLAAFDGVEGETMAALDAIISRALAGRSRTVWEGTFWGGTEQHIIGYGDINQPRPKGPEVEWFAVGLARQKHHYSIYVNAAENGRYLVASYADRLGKVKVGAASIGFKELTDVNVEVLTELLLRANELQPGN